MSGNNKQGVEKLLTPKVQATGLVELVGLGFSKIITEQTLAKIPVIGNNTLKSGGIKLAVGSAGAYYGGKIKNPIVKNIGKFAGGGMVLDGIEDLVLSAMREVKKFTNGGSTNSNKDNW